jgi:hypothetical protein
MKNGEKPMAEWDHMWNGEESPDDLLPLHTRLVLSRLETRLGGSGARLWREKYDATLAGWNRVSVRLDVLIDALEYTLGCEDEARQEWYAEHPGENVISDKNRHELEGMISALKVERMDYAIMLHGLVCLVCDTRDVWAEPWDTLVKDK